MGTHRGHSAAFKAKVVLEAIRGEKTLNELAGLYQIHPNQIGQWRKQALERLPEVFGDGKRTKQILDEELKARLYQEIGQLKVELDFLKKKAGLLG
jgi:transposase-like protein